MGADSSWAEHMHTYWHKHNYERKCRTFQPWQNCLTACTVIRSDNDSFVVENTAIRLYLNKWMVIIASSDLKLQQWTSIVSDCTVLLRISLQNHLELLSVPLSGQFLIKPKTPAPPHTTGGSHKKLKMTTLQWAASKLYAHIWSGRSETNEFGSLCEHLKHKDQRVD